MKTGLCYETNNLLILNMLLIISKDFEGSLKISRPSLRETQDKQALDRETDRSWCHRPTSMIELFWSQPMAPWTLGAAYGQAEKFSA